MPTTMDQKPKRCLAVGDCTVKALPWTIALLNAKLAETLDQATIVLDLVGDYQLAVL